MFFPYYAPVRTFRVGPFSSSEVELRDLVKAWFMISLAFAIVYSSGGRLINFFVMFGVSALTVGLGFIAHEFSHKSFAQRFGCFAEFRASDQMLLLSVVFAFAGFVFAAPGAVLIAGPVDWRRNGVISAAGPSANLVLSLVFYVFYVLSLFLGGFFGSVFYFGFKINGWLAFFNLIPFGNLDGRKVLYWDKRVYSVLVFFSILFSFIL